MKRVLLALAAAALLAGCGDDDHPTTPLPQAGNVFPADGATDVTPVTVLMWTAEEAPVKSLQDYRILMGGGPGSLAQVATTVETHLIRRGLALGATYYWAVEAVGDDGATTRGGPWSFTTVDALAGPTISRYLNGHAWAPFDTVGYGQPIVLSWSAVSPLAATVPPAALALLDTVAPATDGVLGYQYAFTGAVPPDPGDWVPASGFGDVQDFVVPDSATSWWLSVNALDFAGGTVPLASQTLSWLLVINFDPDTRIERSRTYPYYVVFHGPEAGTYNFADGDTVPDRSYVVLRALGWDDPRDVPLSPPGEIHYQGNFRATGLFLGSQPFTFAATYSQPLVADTLGFLVGPFDYEVSMRAIDEHGKRDGTPDTLRFHANFPPCVQCIELLNEEPATAPTVTYDDACGEQACLSGQTSLRVPLGNPVAPTDLSLVDAFAQVWVDPEGDVVFSEPLDPSSYQTIPARLYSYVIYLHGKNPPREYRPDQRIAAWNYQVDYDGDPDNILRDGGGSDDLTRPSHPDTDLFVVENDALPYRGAWVVRVLAGVPDHLQDGGPSAYWAYLLNGAPAPPPAGSPPAVVCAWQASPAVQRAYRIWRLTTMQFTAGVVSAKACDVAGCAWRPGSDGYHYYQGVRVPPVHGWQCAEGAYDDADHLEFGTLDLGDFPTYSDVAVKRFQIEVETTAGSFVGGGDPPGWLACGARWSPARRR